MLGIYKIDIQRKKSSVVKHFLKSTNKINIQADNLA